jgi:hypothetical protein
MITYEQQLDRDFRWALMEGSLHFERDNAVHKTLSRIARQLDELGIPYAVVGGMALFFHGFRRFTEDIDILVTRQGLQEIHRRLEGCGYLVTADKVLRDTDTGVRIDFLVAGDYPGDRLPKPVAFPDPVGVSVEMDGMRFLQLPRLLELKLASGMTTPGRLRDLADAQQTIDTLELPRAFADHLHPFVQQKYIELWEQVQNSPAEP